MDTTSFISEAIRYQKAASDQVFQLISLYQSSTEELLQKTMDQCVWLPENSKKNCLNWNTSCLETTTYLQEIVDKGFEQVEQVFVYPTTKESTPKKAQPKKQQTAAPSQKGTERNKKSTSPKRKASTPAPRATKKAVVSTVEPPKAAPSKTKSPDQKSKMSAPVRNAKAPSTSSNIAAKKVAVETDSSKAKPSVEKVQPKAPMAGGKTQSTSTS